MVADGHVWSREEPGRSVLAATGMVTWAAGALRIWRCSGWSCGQETG